MPYCVSPDGSPQAMPEATSMKRYDIWLTLVLGVIFGLAIIAARARANHRGSVRTG
jgi:hypothetical protein